MIKKKDKIARKRGDEAFEKVAKKQVACIYSIYIHPIYMYIPLYICIPGSCISRRFSRSLFSLFLPHSFPLSLPLAGATCALRNSSFISRVLCSAAAVRPKKFLSRPSARLLSIPPFSLSPPLLPSNVNLNQISLISRVPSNACKNSRVSMNIRMRMCVKYFFYIIYYE